MRQAMGKRDRREKLAMVRLLATRSKSEVRVRVPVRLRVLGRKGER
jgi:hypothetical protein